ncbi:MAG: PilZ domain-containing protein [Cohnella sp.]|jgi:c-di-GMP-binding flagellar brake protein YcgR|uniref:flagellar brake protein n=1 Tax=Cohnella sp. TaxID=1883426 RepID=UPI000E399B77|nr:PilZ domain-containing protein [Cohnella sp.]REK68593.1 MAG: PilZ domain-containing protein [Cohnella sp.]
MLQDGRTARSESANQERELLPLKVLLHCRTAVEKENFLTTGVMTQVEGELFEIELHEFDLFELGETVKLTVYSPAGIHSFTSIVFAKYEGAIAVIQPPDLHLRFQERREFYRVEASGTARILRVVQADGTVKLLPRPLEASLRDISLGGVGMTMPESPELAKAKRLGAIIDLGFTFACDLEIMRCVREDEGLFFGLKMKVLDHDKLRPLRAYVLRQQVEKHVQSRSMDSGKRSFSK